jgi:hypothetical protein
MFAACVCFGSVFGGDDSTTLGPGVRVGRGPAWLMAAHAASLVGSWLARPPPGLRMDTTYLLGKFSDHTLRAIFCLLLAFASVLSTLHRAPILAFLTTFAIIIHHRWR